MSSVMNSSELDSAMDIIEKLVNGKNGEFVIEMIRKYKKNKFIDNYSMLELNHYRDS